MNLKVAPQQVLYDSLKKAISGRPVKTAVFLTYQFEPAFFETEILPALFDSPWSHIPKVRLVQLEESLRGINNLAVYYDRRGLIACDESAKLDYRRIPLSRSTGFFHPKVILLLVENKWKEKTYTSLIVCVASANLTRSGWWENVEVFQILEVDEGEKCAFRQDLRDLLGRIRKESQPDHDHEGLDEIQEFVVRRLEDSSWSQKQDRWLPRLYVGNESFNEFVSPFIRKGEYNLEIVSPFFDSGGDETALVKLLEDCEPKETRIFLPLLEDGTAATSQKYFKLIQSLPRTKWAILPQELLQRGPQQSIKLVSRSVHAKLYRFWNKDFEILFTGSVNLTRPGFSPGKAGNFEVAAMVEPTEDSLHTWWMESIGDKEPDKFLKKPTSEEESTWITLDITFRYRWNTKELAYYCEPREHLTVKTIQVSATGSKLFEFVDLRYERWVGLPEEFARSVETILASTSFLSVKVDNSAPFTVLVQEEGMDQKPSLLRELTPEEILNYWSMLTEEQRERILPSITLTSIELRNLGIVLPAKNNEDTMFDRFAGIFHAFNQVEQTVVKAIDAGREKEAVYRILGEKFDSLPSLVRKVINAKEGDLVNRYVTLLSAEQLLGRIENSFPEFAAAHRAEFKKVRTSLEGTAIIRSLFTFGSEEERAQFFEWFDRAFLVRMKEEREDEE